METRALAAFALALGLVGTAAEPAPRGRSLFARDDRGRVVRTATGERRTYGPSKGARRGRTALPRPPRSAGRRMTPGLTADTAVIPLRWSRDTFGTHIGSAGLHVADIDADGQVEIVADSRASAPGYARRWLVATPDGAGYDVAWASPPLADGIAGLQVAQADSDPALEVVVATVGSSGPSEVRVYDGATRAVESTIVTAVRNLLGLAVADADADGALEAVISGDFGLQVFDLATGHLEYASATYAGGDVAVGNADDDPAPEIVVAGLSGTGWVLDGRTHAVQWVNPTGFGRLVRIADLDGNGRPEVVAAEAWQSIRVIDAVDRSVLRSITTSLDIGALRLLDVEGDGPLEIVYGDGQWGAVHVVDGATGLEKWHVDNPEHGVTDVALGDPDHDGERELLWGAGHTSSGPDHLYVAETATHGVEWESPDLVGPFFGLSWGDVDLDGEVELLAASNRSDSGYGDGIWFVHDYTTRAIEYQSPTTGRDWMGLWRVRHANLDPDPQPEILVATSDLYDGVVLCYDGRTHSEQWRAVMPSGLGVRSLAVADLDGDGDAEVVAGSHVQHTGAPGTFVFVYDGSTGAEQWRSPSLAQGFAGNLSLLRVAQVDADPALEIVVANHGGDLFVIDGVTRAARILGDHAVTALETTDRDRNGVAEILVGTAAGDLRVIDSTTGGVTASLGNAGGRIDGLAVAQLTGDPAPEMVFVVDGRLLVWDEALGEVVASTDVIATDAGRDDSLFAADLEGDGITEVVVNSGSGFRVYGAPAPEPPRTAVADAFVRDGAFASSRFGASPRLLVASGPTGQNRRVHLKFDASDLATCSRATLRLVGTLGRIGPTLGGRAPAPQAITLAARSAEDAAWDEESITGQNAPGMLPVAPARVVVSGPAGTAARYEWDVTDLVQQQQANGRQELGFVLYAEAPGPLAAVFFSREAEEARAPELVLTP